MMRDIIILVSQVGQHYEVIVRTQIIKFASLDAVEASVPRTDDLLDKRDAVNVWSHYLREFG